MDFRIADTFTAALARLPAQDQKAAKTSAFDLQLDPTAPGLQMHRIDKSRDPNFWSVRASRDVRIIVHRTASSLLLAYVGHHDAAYAWAERRQIATHPRTGVVQIVEARELVEEIAPKIAFTTPVLSALEPIRLFERLTGDELLGLGVPPDWLDDVKDATEGTFDALETYRPSEAYYALLSYYVEGVLPTPLPATPTRTLGNADDQPHLRVIQDADELRLALDQPAAPWSSIRRAGFRDFLMGAFRGARTGRPLTRRAADSYCSYVARVESTLGIDLDEAELDEVGVASIVDNLRFCQASAGIPDTTLRSCVSGLRTYARYRSVARDSTDDAPIGIPPVSVPDRLC